MVAHRTSRLYGGRLFSGYSLSGEDLLDEYHIECGTAADADEHLFVSAVYDREKGKADEFGHAVRCAHQ